MQQQTSKDKADELSNGPRKEDGRETSGIKILLIEKVLMIYVVLPVTLHL